MAKIDWVERRLQRWAEAVTVGADGSGFPTMSVLHEDWSPPAPGQTPTLKVGPSMDEVKQTHRAIGFLPLKQSNAICIHYCMRLPMDQQLARLQCSKQTMFDRLHRAHARLAAELDRTK